jgi:hypothetical protein
MILKEVRDKKRGMALNLNNVLQELAKKRPIFHSEADFQHALAWEIREHYPDSKIRLETKIHGGNTKVYLDLLVIHQEHRYAIELKYKTRNFNCMIEGETFSLNNQGAQDIGRYDVLKDIQRLEQMVVSGVANEGFLVFLTNDGTYIKPSLVKDTVDREFKVNDGRRLTGELKWGEQTGQGTLKGREKPIVLKGEYKVSWQSYKKIDDSSSGEFQYLLLAVKDIDKSKIKVPSTERVSAMEPKLDLASKVQDTQITQMNRFSYETSIHWFHSFSQKGEIPNSQNDLRDRIVNHLRDIGYQVQINREMGNCKIDIWGEKGNEKVAIEVRYKTTLLQTINNGSPINLKKQGAYDISRYDFISDLGKVEKVVRDRPDVKGYALLLTNDHLYWQTPKKKQSMDEAFHIYEGHTVTGVCSWKVEASTGTTSGREKPIELYGEYQMNWKPYHTLGSKKNEEFRALLVKINNSILS